LTNNRAVSDNRRAPRTALGVTLDLRVAGDQPTTCRAVIADVSPKGMSIETDAVLEEGMTLHLKVPRTMDIRGEVRHAGVSASGRRRYGVRFHKIGLGPTN
jgi:hypothetical protein